MDLILSFIAHLDTVSVLVGAAVLTLGEWLGRAVGRLVWGD